MVFKLLGPCFYREVTNNAYLFRSYGFLAVGSWYSELLIHSVGLSMTFKESVKNGFQD